MTAHLSTMQSILLAGALLVAPSAFAQQASGQAFPDKPILLYNAYSTGGTSSLTMRALADAASKSLGKRVIVEDKPGAGGALAPAIMSKAKPDGYTLSQMPQPMLRIPHIQNVSYDALKDFTWIIRVVDYTYGVVVKADAPWKTWNEFIAYAKANPGKITYGTSGIGTTMHVAMEEVAALERIKWVQVTYKGVPEMNSAVLGGHIDIVASSTGWAEMVDAGRLRILAAFGANRIKRWPNVPTLKELGYNVVASSSYGIGGPKDMDSKVVRILHDAFKQALDDPDFVKTMEGYNQETSYLGTESYSRWAREQYEVEKRVVERLKLKQ